MKYPLAATVVFAFGLMGFSRTGCPVQQPGESTTQPVQAPPQTTPEAQQPSLPPTGTPTEPPSEQSPAGAPQQEPSAQPASPQPSSSEQPAKPTTKKKPKARKPKKTDPPPETPTKKVVPNGGTSEPEVQIAPRLSNRQQSDQRQKISNLLSETEANLHKMAGRQLKASEEETVSQIRMYMEQAKQATEAGDLQRAQNLAAKANLLSIDLVGK